MQAWLVSNQSMKCSENNFCNEILATDLTVDFIFFHGIMAQCNVNIPNSKDYRFCHSLIFWHLERIKKRYFAWLYHNIWLIRTSFWFLILTIRHSFAIFNILTLRDNKSIQCNVIYICNLTSVVEKE